MRQFAIWGIGERLAKFINLIDLNQVYCFIDANPQKVQSTFLGKKVFSPDEIEKSRIDYFVISSDKFFDEIALYLITKLGIELKNILNLETFLSITDEKNSEYLNPIKLIDLFFDIIYKYHFTRMLDWGMYLGRIGYWHEGNLEIDACICDTNNDFYMKKPYLKIWKETEIKGYTYDIIIIALPERDSLQLLCKSLESYSENIFFRISGDIFSDAELMKQISVVNFKGYLFGTFMSGKSSETIFEVSHKEFIPIGDTLYQPLYVGGIKKDTEKDLYDDSGDHIAQFNPYINEGTALYWMWKNTEEQIVGLNHYRRFFQSPVNNYSPIQKWEMEQLLQQYDICVACPVALPRTVKEMLRKEICEEAFQAVFPEIEKIFKEIGGQEWEAFQYVMRGRMIYPCNMFLTTRAILNHYCEWLFPILFQLLEKVKIDEKWDNYSKRVIGFVAERLLTVWLVQRNYKIKELPILFVDHGDSI